MTSPSYTMGPFHITSCSPTTNNFSCSDTNPCTSSSRETTYLYVDADASSTGAPVQQITDDQISTAVNAQFYLLYNNSTDTNCSIAMANGANFYIGVPLFSTNITASIDTGNSSTWQIGIPSSNNEIYYLNFSTLATSSPTTGFVHLVYNENQWWLNYNKGVTTGLPNKNLCIDNISSNTYTNPLTTDNGNATCNYTFSFIPLTTTDNSYSIIATSPLGISQQQRSSRLPSSISIKTTTEVGTEKDFVEVFFKSSCNSCTDTSDMNPTRGVKVKTSIPSASKYKIIRNRAPNHSPQYFYIIPVTDDIILLKYNGRSFLLKNNESTNIPSRSLLYIIDSIYQKYHIKLSLI